MSKNNKNEDFNFGTYKDSIVNLITEDVYKDIILSANHPHELERRFTSETVHHLNRRNILKNQLLFSKEDSKGKIFSKNYYIHENYQDELLGDILFSFKKSISGHKYMIFIPKHEPRTFSEAEKMANEYLDESLNGTIDIDQKGIYRKYRFPFHVYEKDTEVYEDLIRSFEISPTGLLANKISELTQLRSYLIEQLTVHSEQIDTYNEKIKRTIIVYAYQTLKTFGDIQAFHRKRRFKFFETIDDEPISIPYYEKAEEFFEKIGFNTYDFYEIFSELAREFDRFIDFLLNQFFVVLPRDKQEWLELRRLILANPFLPEYLKRKQYLGILENAAAKEPYQYATRRMIAQLNAIESILEDYYLDVDLKTTTQYENQDSINNYDRTIGNTRLTFEQLWNYRPNIEEIANARANRNSDPKGSNRTLIKKALKVCESEVHNEKFFDPYRKVAGIVREIIEAIPELKDSQSTIIGIWVNEYFSVWRKNVIKRDES